jgi:hypothetical protein
MLNFAYYYNPKYFKQINTLDINETLNESFEKEHIVGLHSIDQIEYQKWEKILYMDAGANFTYPNNNIEKNSDIKYRLINRYHFDEIFNISEYELK